MSLLQALLLKAWVDGNGGKKTSSFAGESASLDRGAGQSSSQRTLGCGAMVRAPKERVLMLDIDGVLHPGDCGSLIYMPMLEAWLRKHRCVDVVISSNWRETRPFDELRGLFAEDVRGQVIGTTPVLEDAYREEEILALVKFERIAVWAAVDDRAELFPSTGSLHLAKTEPLDGLTEKTFERLERLLQI